MPRYSLLARDTIATAFQRTDAADALLHPLVAGKGRLVLGGMVLNIVGDQRLVGLDTTVARAIDHGAQELTGAIPSARAE